MLTHTASYGYRIQRLGPNVGAETRERFIRKRGDILQQGEVASDAHILLEGLAYRYQLLNDGRRAITAFLLPGDLCELRSQRNGPTHYGIAAASSCTLAAFAPDSLNKADANNPELAALLDRQGKLEEAIARAWIVGLSQRNAQERLAHLFCELRARFAAIGMATETTFELRLGQVELADALGITPIHVHRALKALREAELMKFKGGVVTILDRPALEKLAIFNPAYLRL